MADVVLTGLPLDSPHSGTAVYSRNLLSHLPGAAPDLSFRVLMRQSNEVVGVPSSVVDTPFRHLKRGRGFGARLDKLAWEIVALPLSAALGFDKIIHSLYFAAPPAPMTSTSCDFSEASTRTLARIVSLQSGGDRA